MVSSFRGTFVLTPRVTSLYTLMPLRITSPDVGISVRPMIFSKVDFPEPEGPEIAAKSPA